MGIDLSTLQQAELVKMLLASSSDGIVIKDTLGIIQVVNAPFCAMMGKPAEELLGQTSHNLLSKEDAEFVHKQDTHVVNTSTTQSQDKILTYVDGQERWIHISTIPLFDQSNASVGVISIIRSQIANTHQTLLFTTSSLNHQLTEYELEFGQVSLLSLFDLKTLQQLQDTFAKATGVASIITQPDGTPITEPSNFTYLCENIIRKTDIGLQNCIYSDAIVGSPNVNEPLIQPCLSCGLWDSGTSITIGDQHVANWLIGQVRNSDLDDASIMAYAKLIGADEAAYRAALDDVTEMSSEQFEHIAETLFLIAKQLSTMAHQNLQQAREMAARQQAQAELQSYRAHLETLVKERTAELEKANGELAALSRVKDEFVSNVSHELQTPITNIMLRQYLITKKPEETAAHLEVIQRETQRLRGIIDGLLTLSRMDQGHTTLELTSIDLNAFIQNYVTDRHVIAEEKRIQLTYELHPHQPLVHADNDLLGQTLSILLTNALAYTPDGGSVNVRVIADNATCVGFAVKDNGTGILLDEQPRLFERFFRGSASHESHIPGTGLGLALAKEIIDKHGGVIQVASEGIPGKGSEFTVQLPTIY